MTDRTPQQGGTVITHPMAIKQIADAAKVLSTHVGRIYSEIETLRKLQEILDKEHGALEAVINRTEEKVESMRRSASSALSLQAELERRVRMAAILCGVWTAMITGLVAAVFMRGL